MDGATNFQAFRKVIIPLAAPGLATTAILAFIAAWNEFLLATHADLLPRGPHHAGGDLAVHRVLAVRGPARNAVGRIGGDHDPAGAARAAVPEAHRGGPDGGRRQGLSCARGCRRRLSRRRQPLPCSTRSSWWLCGPVRHPRHREPADRARPRHRAAGRVPRARPAAAAGAHPGARARAPRALPPLERLRVPGAAAGARRADHGRATRSATASRCPRGRAADHRLPGRDHRDRGAGGADRRDGDLDRDRAPPAALRDLVLRAPVRLPRRGAGVQPPARDRQRLRRRPVGARVLVRAVRGHARLAGRVPDGAAARAQRAGTACGWCAWSTRRPAWSRSRSAACGSTG